MKPAQLIRMVMAHRTQNIRILLTQKACEELRPRLRMRLLCGIGAQNELAYIMKQCRPLHALAQSLHRLISPLCRNHKNHIGNILFLKKISCPSRLGILDFPIFIKK